MRDLCAPQTLEALSRRGQIFGSGDARNRAPCELTGAVAEHRAEGTVAVPVAAIAVGEGDADRRVLEGIAKQAFAEYGSLEERGGDSLVLRVLCAGGFHRRARRLECARCECDLVLIWSGTRRGRPVVPRCSQLDRKWENSNMSPRRTAANQVAPFGAMPLR